MSTTTKSQKATPQGPASSISTLPEPSLRYVARKKLVINGKTYKPGDEVPEAKDVLRIEGWVRAGLVNEVWR